MMEMPEKLKQRRDELYPCVPYAAPTGIMKFMNEQRRIGFNACWEELAPLVEALMTIECNYPEMEPPDSSWTAEEHFVYSAKRLARQALAAMYTDTEGEKE